MKFSEHCLRKWVNLDLSTDALAEQLTLIGLEVDSVTPVAASFSGVVVGEVLSTEQHPNADKLTCCKVNVGADEPLAIVCGAKNVRAGIRVAVATVGAVLPGDFKIKKSKLRGEVSEGMICSAGELGLTFWHPQIDGILELPLDAPVGKDFIDYYKAKDHVIDIEITPNRGDCLGVRGIARDLAAVSAKPLLSQPAELVPAELPSSVRVNVDEVKLCPHYVGRVIRDVNMNVDTPSWLRFCLERAGIRPINPIVDVCNYVMIELGQPMHGFDLAKVSGGITVRAAMEGEQCALLDDREVTLSPSDLVIADDEKVLALAGVMGSVDSGVTLNTTDVFLESAFFEPKTVCLSGRRHGINTDSSYRYERGVDYQLQVDAIERATSLILEITGGQVEELVEMIASDELPSRNPILLRRESISRLLGIKVADQQVQDILTRLGMQVSAAPDGWSVVAPSYRFDVSLQIDLIEEIARMVGYAQIPTANIEAPLTMRPHTETTLSDGRIKSCLVDRGYNEAITYSFIDPKYHALFAPDLEAIVLDNPLSKDLSVMRNSLWPGLLQALQMNLRHQVSRVRLFETGQCFTREGGVLNQVSKLGLVATGPVNPEQWGIEKRATDFYDMKSDVSALFVLTGCDGLVSWRVEENATLHPGRSAALYLGDVCVGWLGELHPGIADQLGIKQSVIMGEFILDQVKVSQSTEFKSYSKFPAVRRDLAFVVDNQVSVATLIDKIKENATNQLQAVEIFDVYHGQNVENGKKSIALGLTFQDASRTLRDEEINEIIHGVVTVLQNELAATLRA